MTIKATYEALQTIAATVLPTFTFLGMYKSNYNTERTIADNTIIVEPPRQWPLNPRENCQAKFTANVWIAIRPSILSDETGTFEYSPFSEIDIRDTLVNAANTFVYGINNYSTLQVINSLDLDSLNAVIYDAPEGQSTNWQAWLNFKVDLISYGTVGVYVPPVFAPGLTNLTQYTIQNGSALPTGLTPDVLYIETPVITDDIETAQYDIDAIAGYLFKEAFILSGVDLTGFNIYDKNDSIIAAAGAIKTGVITSASKFPTGESLFYENEYLVGYIRATGNTSPGFQVVLKFERSKL